MPEEEDKAWQRLDKFLFFARFCKTRAVAGQLIETGAVRINRQPTIKPHAKLRPNDVITLPLPRGVVVVRVVSLSNRRGPATEAQLLYEEVA
ncbi:MAG: heat-shock protein [Acidocella sp. 20-57-95]|nr:MAG: heat-shock protein [Acidocella sp. 20-57-95]OYV62498.1 MAG: heat-shock protein [Acidocella sp. 21-58-7]HQT64081.1 S4 domain-containing protein [Acidocella sp.]HQU03341.1 S4 domain-containing protein [Acidocella sp.]